MRLGHVHLKVRNLDRAERFYQKLLGAVVSEQVPGQYSFLTLGSSHHDIALQAIGEDAPAASPRSVGLYHSAFEVDDVPQLRAVVRTLEEEALRYQLVDHGISWAIYTQDSDGNGVEIYLDRRSSTQGAYRWEGISKNIPRETIMGTEGGLR